MLKFNAMLFTTVCVVLVGCSTTPSSSNVAEAAATNKYDVDWEYVTKIERNNRASALPGRVIWVNPPMKVVDEDS